MNTNNKPRSAVFRVESNAEDMLLLHRKQKEAWLANGIPNYAARAAEILRAEYGMGLSPRA